MQHRVALPALIPLAALLAFAQDQPSTPAAPAGPAPAAPARIATIFAQNAIASTQEGQKAAAALAARYDPQRRDFEKKQGELRALGDQLKRGMATMSADARSKLNQTFDARSTELKRLGEDIQARVDEEEAALMQQLGDKLLKVIDGYALEHGFAVVLDVSVQQGAVLWAVPTIDITNDIVKLYDKAYPVPATPAAPPPPTKKP